MPARIGYQFRPNTARAMSSPAPTASTLPPAANDEPPPPQDGWPGGLPALRAELDRIDADLHDLLMRRATVVEAVAHSGKRVAWRPGREADIVRRLLARHGGHLPPQSIYRIWRELLAGTTAMQGGFQIAVCERDVAAGFTQLAREHFGALTPLHTHGGPAQAIGEVGAGIASMALLPMPSETEIWWTSLLHREEPRIHIAARLPFWAAPRPDGSPAVQALVVSPAAPDPSDQDRTLLGLELEQDISRDRLSAAFAAAGLGQSAVWVLRRDQGAPLAQALVEVDGHLPETDPRLDKLNGLSRRPVVLGGYAVPFERPEA
jgi:chorismate mutase / prephenate dehydratase